MKPTKAGDAKEQFKKERMKQFKREEQPIVDLDDGNNSRLHEWVDEVYDDKHN